MPQTLRLFAVATLFFTGSAIAQSNATSLEFANGRSHPIDATASSALRAASQSRTWQSFGPPSGEAPHDLVAHPFFPDVIFATAPRGVLRSSDRGRSWEFVFAFWRAQHVAVNPLTPQVIVAGGPNGFARSIDEGANWQMLSTEGVDAIAFAADGTLLVAWGERGLLRSVDNGDSWTAPAGLQQGRTFSSIAAGGSLVVAASGSSVFRSSDNGAHWTEAKKPGSAEITAIAVSTSGIVYVGHDGISRSTDAGSNWTRINSGLPSQLTTTHSDFVTEIATDPASNAVFAALFESGIYRSLDGTTWQPAGDRAANQHPFALLVSGSTLLATSSPYAIARSEDRGSTWSASNRGVPGGEMRALAIAGSTIYVGDFDGQTLFVSTNGGFTWTPANGLPQSPVMSLAIWPADPRIMFAGTGGAGVWKSDDAGVSWRPTALGGTTVHGVAIDPSNPSLVYAMSTGMSIYRTTDAGASWTDIGKSFNFGTQLSMSNIGADPTHPGVVYLAAEKAYVSRDAGATWNAIVETGSFITTSESAVYAFMGRRLVRSTDAALTWTAVTPELPTLPPTKVTALLIDENSGAAYLALAETMTNDSFILRSANGSPWETLPSIPGAPQILRLAASGTTLYVATSQGGYAISFAPPQPRQRAVRR